MHSELRTLGRSGLLVSPLALGTMTFGNKGWGSTDEISQAVFNAYVEAGGNFFDTADVYSGGRSEELLGDFLAERKLRDRIVLATKFSFNGGNSRKNMHRALEGSLRRLRTDYVDLYWMHVWDTVTPLEEVLQAMGELVRAGKIRYFGLSDMPAWYATRMATMAEAQHAPGPIAMQMEYSLVERGIEREHIPAAVACGMGVMPWSPLAGGFLSGKYSRSDQAAKGRLSGSNPFQGPFSKFTERNWRVLDALQSVAAELAQPLAQVALAWTLGRPDISSPVLGAKTVEQLQNNIAALTLQLSDEQRKVLDEVSMPEGGISHAFFGDGLRRMIFGGAAVRGRL